MTVARQRDSSFLVFCFTVSRVTVKITNRFKIKPAAALVEKNLCFTVNIDLKSTPFSSISPINSELDERRE